METKKISRTFLILSSLLFAEICIFVSVFHPVYPAKLKNVQKTESALRGPDEKTLFFSSLLESAKGAVFAPHAYSIRILGEPVVLAKQREKKALPPASLTKLLTCLLAYEELSPNELVLLTDNARAVEEKRGPAEAGETFLRDDMIRLALVASANDATLALADAVGGKRVGDTFEERIHIFVDLMNERAKSLGLSDSHFMNPTGLDENMHVMSAEDVSRLAEYIWFNTPRLFEILRTNSITVKSEKGREYVIENTNELLKEFPALRGGKTGFTDNARGTLLLFYPLRPRFMTSIVILGSDDRFEDGREIIRWLERMPPH